MPLAGGDAVDFNGGSCGDDYGAAFAMQGVTIKPGMAGEARKGPQLTAAWGGGIPLPCAPLHPML